MTMSILFFWSWELVIVIHNVSNKTPESFFRLHEASEVLNKYVMAVGLSPGFRSKGGKNHKGVNIF